MLHRASQGVSRAGGYEALESGGPWEPDMVYSYHIGRGTEDFKTRNDRTGDLFWQQCGSWIEGGDVSSTAQR